MVDSNKFGVDSDPSADLDINRQRYKDTLGDPRYPMNGDFIQDIMPHKIEFPAAPINREPLDPGIDPNYRPGPLTKIPTEPDIEWPGLNIPELDIPGLEPLVPEPSFEEQIKINYERLKEAEKLPEHVAEAKQTLDGIKKYPNESTPEQKIMTLEDDINNIDGSIKAREDLIREKYKNEIKQEEKEKQSKPIHHDPHLFMDNDKKVDDFGKLYKPSAKERMEAELKTYHDSKEYKEAKEVRDQAAAKKEELEKEQKAQEKKEARDKVQGPEGRANDSQPANSVKPKEPASPEGQSKPDNSVQPKEPASPGEQPRSDNIDRLKEPTSQRGDQPKPNNNDRPNEPAKETAGLDIKLDNQLAESLKGKMTMSDSYVAELNKPKGSGMSVV